MTALDPVLVWTLRLSLALLFAAAVRAKLQARDEFVAAVRAYRLAPAELAAPLAAALLAAEAAAAALLAGWPQPEPGAALAAALLVVYAGAMATNLARGRRDLDCGCGGPGRRRPVSTALVARNLVLAAAALALLAPASERVPTWLDAATVAAATAAVAALWTAAARLDANRPALARMRSGG